MTSLLKTDLFMTPEEYLEGEGGAEVRHEYIDGSVYAMAGGTQSHNKISGNIFASLHVQLNAPCGAFISDMKVMVKTLTNESFYYPDVVVSCAVDDKNPQFLEKPTTIFEVLSESTERIDRKEKFLAYTSLKSLEEYVLVSQSQKMVTIVRRVNDWQPEVVTGDDFSIDLFCGGLVDSQAIYKNIEF